MGALKIGVGATTRQRLKGLQDLLDSYATLEFPDGAEVVFLFCENDTVLGAQDTIDSFAAATGFDAALELQTEPGIPFARNTVLDMALARGCDYLTFVDDDETVAPDWLVRLVDAAQARDLDLTGGPVTFVAPEGDLNWMQRSMFAYVEERMHKRRKTRAKAARDGSDQKLNIYTNNWCAKLASVTAFKVRFNEKMAFTGGTDTCFSLDMKAAGAKIGWAPEAHVYEVVPKPRLNPGYQFARARDQAANSVRLRNYSLLRVIPYSIARFFDGVLNIVVSPVMGGKYFAKGIYKFGIGAGRIKGALGRESRHYAPGSENVHTE